MNPLFFLLQFLFNHPLIWLAIGFLVGSFNQILFKIPKGDGRAPIFGMTLVFWPITALVDTLVVIGKSMDSYLGFLGEIPYYLSSWKYKRVEKRKNISA